MQVSVGRGDHPHIDLARGQGTDSQNFLILQCPEKLCLSGKRHVANFVEKNRALVGELKEAHLILVGPGERAANVAEEFALEERFHHRRTVQHHKTPVL